jgi:hypothetical protein
MCTDALVQYVVSRGLQLSAIMAERKEIIDKGWS